MNFQQNNGNTAKLILFTRYPEPGKTKTRLIPALGTQGAADLQRQMTEHMLAQALPLKDIMPVDLEIRFTGGDRLRMQRWLGKGLTYTPQGSGDLGDRLERAFREAFVAGAQRVVVTGIDCPDIDAALLAEAFQQLSDRDVVLGPATDGGYYLIGMRRLYSALLADIPWSTSVVLSRTLEVAREQGLSVHLLKELSDIDLPEDLPVWEAAAQRPTISAIVPVLNEARNLEKTLQPLQQAQNVEIILADGGSEDTTVEVGRNLGARVVSSPKGRARQMNAGAEVATGEILLFLHADTRLPEGFEAAVRQTLKRPGVTAGAFELTINSPNWQLRWIELGVKWRSRFLQMPYGDQAIFLQRATFQALGGFPNLPIMEDFVFVRRLHKLGRVAIAPYPVLTSARRWERLGVWQTTLLNQIIIAGYFLGVPPETLARWYRRR